MRMKYLALAGAALLLSAGTASAAVVTHGLNLRSGPSTSYRVIDTMPAGAHVRVLGCGTYWCRVSFRGIRGYAGSSYLAGHRRYVARRYYGGERYYYGGPTVAYSYPYYGSGWGWGGYGYQPDYAYEPGFSIGFGFGGGWPYWYHGGYYHHWRR